MTWEKILRHHEKLRYDYLLKNIHYLNDKEKRDLLFLQAKLDGQQARSVVVEEAKANDYSDPNTVFQVILIEAPSSRRSGGTSNRCSDS